MHLDEEWAFEFVVELIKKLQARSETGFRVSPDTGRLIVRALRLYAMMHFVAETASFQIDVWTSDGTRVERHYADISDLEVARVAFDKAMTMYPHNTVTLRQGARVVRRSNTPEI